MVITGGIVVISQLQPVCEKYHSNLPVTSIKMMDRTRDKSRTNHDASEQVHKLNGA